MENTQLTIADLASIKSTIEAACSRGAFKADEMVQVGTVYSKLTAFLESIAAAQQAQAEATANAEAPADADESTQPQGEANA
jgi:hypothetical protein